MASWYCGDVTISAKKQTQLPFATLSSLNCLPIDLLHLALGNFQFLGSMFFTMFFAQPRDGDPWIPGLVPAPPQAEQQRRVLQEIEDLESQALQRSEMAGKSHGDVPKCKLIAGKIIYTWWIPCHVWLPQGKCFRSLRNRFRTTNNGRNTMGDLLKNNQSWGFHGIIHFRLWLSATWQGCMRSGLRLRGSFLSKFSQFWNPYGLSQEIPLEWMIWGYPISGNLHMTYFPIFWGGPWNKHQGGEAPASLGLSLPGLGQRLARRVAARPCATWGAEGSERQGNGGNTAFWIIWGFP